MLRFEREYQEKLEALNRRREICIKRLEEFKSLIPKIDPIIKKYKIAENLDYSNCYLDDSLGRENNPIFRVHLKIDSSSLSDRQISNLENKLREQKIPMPICPISLNSIHICLHD